MQDLTAIPSPLKHDNLSTSEMEQALLRAPLAVAVCRGIDHRIVLLNPVFEKFAGLSAARLIGHPVSHVLSPSVINEINEMLNRVSREGQSLTITIQLQGNVPYQLTALPLSRGKADEGSIAVYLQPTSEARRHGDDTETILRKTKEQLELSINAGGIGIWHWDVRKNVMTWSKEQMDIFGVAPEEFHGRAEDFFKHVVPEDREKISAASQLEFERSDNQYDFRIKRKDGTIRWIQSRSRTFLDANGNADYITGINIDITDQKEAEEKLKFAATLSQSIADAVIGASTVENDFSITSWNAGAEKTYGWKAEEVIGKPARDILRTLSSDTVERSMRWEEVLAQGYWREEVVQTHKDGHAIDIQATISLVRDNSGKPIGIVAVNRDITESKKIEQAYRHAREQLELSFSNIQAGIYKFSSKGDLEYVNKAGAELMGFESPEAIGNAPAMEMLRDHMQETYFVLDEWGKAVPTAERSTYKAFQSGKRAEVVSQFIHKKTGKILWILSNSTPFHKENGELVFVLTTTTDITAQKIAEQKIRESEQQFKHSKEQLEQTFRNIPAGVFLVSKSGQMLFANDNAARMTGFSSAEEMLQIKNPQIITKRLADTFEMFDEREQPLSFQNSPASRTLKTGQPADAVIKVVNKHDGSYSWVLSKSSPLFNPDGSLSRVLIISTDVSQQKKAEREIKLSEERLRDLAVGLEEQVRQRTEQLSEKNRQLNEAQQIAKVGSWEWNPVTNDVTWSDEMYNIYGYEGKRFPVTFDKATERMTPGEREQSRQRVSDHIVKATERFKETGDRKHDNPPLEYEIVLPNGKKKMLRGIAQILLSEDGRVAKIAGTIQDITEEKDFENTIRLINRQLSEAQEIAQLGSWEWNIDSGKLTWSRNMYLIYGLNPAVEVTYDSYVSLLHPMDRQHVQETIARSLKEARFHEFYHRIITPAGLIKILHSRGEIVVDGKGKVIKMIGTGQDVTAQKLIENKLIETNEMLEERNTFVEKLINSSLDLIMVVDRDLRFITLNKKAQSVMGPHIKGKLIGSRITDINPGIEETESYRDLIQAFKGEIIIRDKVKSTISDSYYEHNYVPLVDFAGQVYAVMIISHDITEGIRQLEELKKLNESDKLKSDFIKMASHELKTPVTSIKGYVQLLLSALQKDHEKPLSPSLMKLSLVSIDKQITRLTRLLSELLDLSKIEAGKLELSKEKFNINQLVIETVQDVLYSHSKHNINIFHDYGSDVFADKDRIGQVLINLLTNAIKYSPNSDRIEVRIKQVEHAHVGISVRDYGIGIEQRYHPKIFGRFYRVEGKEEQTYPGFGIGLFLTKEIIEHHGGTVYFTSEKGKGSEFTFTIPSETADRAGR